MPFTLDPNRSVVNITIYYVEEEKMHGNSVYHFIRSEQDMKEWTAEGFKVEPERKPAPHVPGAAQQYEKREKPTFANRMIGLLRTTWRRPTWRDQNSIMTQATRRINTEGENINIEIDPVTYRDLKLKKCLVGWDILDNDGKPVDVTPDTIDLLPPEIAGELLSSFEKITEPSETDLKNWRGRLVASTEVK